MKLLILTSANNQTAEDLNLVSQIIYNVYLIELAISFAFKLAEFDINSLFY